MALLQRTSPTKLIPLKMTHDQVVLVGNTRVTLDTVIDAFVSGATPEEIVYQYPALELEDIYAVIGYYLHHRTEVDGYLWQRQKQAESIRQKNEAKFSLAGMRKRLLARL